MQFQRLAHEEDGMTPRGLGSGDVPGLQDALRDALRQYRPSEVGVCWIDPVIGLTMPLEAWNHYTWVEIASVTIPAQENDLQTIYTVPDNLRALVHHIRVVRTSGDNTILSIRATSPAGFRAGDGQVTLHEDTTGASEIYWPDDGNQANAFITIKPYNPIWWEPGTIFEVDPTGAGVASSVFAVDILMTRQKTFSARPP